MPTLADIAERYRLQLDGDGGIPIIGLCGIGDDLPQHLSFIRDPAQAALAAASRIAAFVVPPATRVQGKATLRHPNPDFAIAMIAELFAKPACRPPQGVHASAVIAASASFGRSVAIGPHVSIGERVCIGQHSQIMAGCVVMDDVRIGSDCLIYPNCVVREGVQIGDRVILQPGVVLGGDGYGFVWDGSRHFKIPQLGTVVIEDDVEIGANCTIDRGRFTATRIGRGTKIDNLVMVAHNVQVGRDCLLVAQSGISGSTRLGNRVTLAGQVGIVGHIEIGDDVTVLGQSMVTKNIERPGAYAGSPARPAQLWQRAIAGFYRAAKGRSTAPDTED
jgi:UDP-3-O-[3-hydroxymyristoyl] glucosamine N-acyltransferase